MNSKQRRQYNRKWKYVARLDSNNVQYDERLKHDMNIVFIAKDWATRYIGSSNFRVDHAIPVNTLVTTKNMQYTYCMDFKFKDSNHYEWFLLRFGDELVH